MYNDEYFYCILCFIAGIFLSLGICAWGDFNTEYTKSLAQDVCQLRFNTSAQSYENGILTCSNPNVQTYQIDYKWRDLPKPEINLK